METLGKKGFLALPSPYSDFDNAKIVIVPFGYAPDIFQTIFAPKCIIEASHNVDDFDESRMAAGDNIKKLINIDLKKDLDKCESLRKNGVATLPYKIIIPHHKTNKIEEEFIDLIEELIKKDKIPIILGGDHNITPLSIKAIKRMFDNISVLHFDSRLDMLDNSSHRSVMRKIFPYADTIVSVGFRSVAREEMEFRYRNTDKIHGIMMRDQLRPLWNLQTAIRNIVHYLKDKNVYITFDTSFLDPSTIIGAFVKTPEPGGMTYDEVLDIWVKILPKINVIGADFVEFCPDNQSKFNPEYAFAKLISRFISRLKIKSGEE